MASPAWHVIADQITQTSTLKPGGGGIVDVYEVPYEIDSGPAKGHTGRVTIPANAFDAKTVTEAVQQQVNAVHDVGQVSSAGA